MSAERRLLGLVRAEGATPLAGRTPFHQKGYASLGRLLHPVRVSIVARRHRTKPLRNGPPSTKSGLDSRPAVTTRGRNGAEGPPSLTRPQFHDLYGIVGPRERGRRAESCTRATVGLRSCRTCAELVRTISFQTGVLQNLNHFSRTRATWSSPFVARVRNWFETFPSELGLCGITTVFRALVRRGPFPCCTCADAAEADQPRPPTAGNVRGAQSPASQHDSQTAHARLDCVQLRNHAGPYGSHQAHARGHRVQFRNRAKPPGRLDSLGGPTRSAEEPLWGSPS